MKKLLLFACLICCGGFAVAQKSQRTLEFLKNNPHAIYGLPKPSTADPATRKGEKTFCGLKVTPSDNYNPAPEEYLRQFRNANGRIDAGKATAKFIVTYDGFTADSKKAVQRAIDIWSVLLDSPVPIRLYIKWSADLGDFNNDPNVLGGAYPADFYNGRFFQGALKTSTWYPMALAEKLNRAELNDSTEYDIEATFNANYAWNFEDTPATGTKIDLTTVVLHEIGHGLGFYGSIRAANSWGFNGTPVAFDHFVSNTLDQQLINTTLFANPSDALKNQVESRKINFSGPLAEKSIGSKPKLYAPIPYSAGSSIYHLDEQQYPKNDPNELMTPNISGTNRNPGAAALGIFADLGWKATVIKHDILRDSENQTSAVQFKVAISSDTAISNPKVFYSINPASASTITYTSAPLVRIGTSNQYAFSLPASASTRLFVYYFTVDDATGRTFNTPAESPAKGYYVFTVGPDTEKPNIYHAPIFLVNPADVATQVITAGVEDNTEIDQVYLEYKLNNGAVTKVNLSSTNKDAYGTGNYTYKIPTLKLGDAMSYRIVATDKAKAVNTAYLPDQTNFYSFVVVQPTSVKDSYSNDFNTAGADKDFAGFGFSVGTPTSSFQNAAINSDHPYKLGTGPNNESNFVYQLLTPIKIKASEATIEFDEIAMVEPGDAGSVFGDNDFWDFVIVEGSKDGGVTWRRFLSGYDCRAQIEWETLWNRNKNAQTGTSSSVPTQELYRKRSIDMLKSGSFKANDNVLIRFRLFSDSEAQGWGWAIDNLRIQLPPITATQAEPVITINRLEVYPNPSNGDFITIDATWKGNTANLNITDALGQHLHKQILTDKTPQKINLGALANGMYLISLEVGEERLVKKFIVAK
jgi:hypothetical protein